VLGILMATRSDEPGWVRAILESPLIWFIARLFLVSAYLYGGFTKLFDFPGAIAEQARFHLEPAAVWAVLAITVEIGGSLLILVGRFVWLGAGAIGVLTLIAASVTQQFWALQGAAQIAAFNGFLERLGLLGGLILVAALAHCRRQVLKSKS
jgi:uncharacterized membrane protein YphA (DoxX/SURF4 family)